MPHVVTARCISNEYTDCCTVCPVDCFYEIDDPKMLVIDPDTCIDCQACVPVCPVHAIWPEEELPEAYAEWKDKNRELFPAGKVITEAREVPEGAVELEDIQEREKAAGLSIEEPSAT